MALNIKNLSTRSFTAIIFVIVLVGAILWNVYSFTFLFFIISIWGLVEFYKLIEKNNVQPNKLFGIICGILVYGWNIIPFKSNMSDPFMHLELLTLIIPFIFIIFIAELFRKSAQPFLNIGATLLGIIYVVLPLKLFTTIPIKNHLISLSDSVYSWQIPFGIILLIWSNDTFAYLIGSLFGKNKLFERISPGKTWEGTVGSGIVTICCSMLFNNWFNTFLTGLDWAIIAAIIVSAGTIGDLIESMLKRSVDVKDSGSIMPGHGGILDRFDSLIISAPFIFTYLFLAH